MLYVSLLICFSFIFFFTDTATTEIYTLSLHDALPICDWWCSRPPAVIRNDRLPGKAQSRSARGGGAWRGRGRRNRSEEHTSELQSRRDLVCRLLLEKKKNNEYT